MKFIHLTDIHVNVDHFTPDYSSDNGFVIGREPLMVNETPDEILAAA